MLVKATYKKTETAVVSRIRRDSSYPHNSTGAISDRRMTYSTDLPSNYVEQLKAQYDTVEPKLHVAEIISVQASELFPEVQDPVFETIQNGTVNKGCNLLENSNVNKDSSIIATRDSNIDDYYNLTNNSSVSIDSPDWIRCVSSPSSSVYENSLNDYETGYLERTFPDHSTLKGINEDTKQRYDINEAQDDSSQNTNHEDDTEQKDNKIDNEIQDIVVPGNNKELIDEIMQYFETNDTNVKLDPNLLCPNRKEDYKIIFVEDY